MPNINKVVFGNQTLIDLSTTTLSSASQLESGVTAYARDGSVITGTGSSGGSGSVTQDQDGYIVIPPDGGSSSGTGTVVIEDTTDTAGGTIRTITAVDISDTTAVAADVASGKYFYDASGVKTVGTGGNDPTAEWQRPSSWPSLPNDIQTASIEYFLFKKIPGKTKYYLVKSGNAASTYAIGTTDSSGNFTSVATFTTNEFDITGLTLGDYFWARGDIATTLNPDTKPIDYSYEPIVESIICNVSKQYYEGSSGACFNKKTVHLLTYNWTLNYQYNLNNGQYTESHLQCVEFHGGSWSRPVSLPINCNKIVIDNVNVTLGDDRMYVDSYGRGSAVYESISFGTMSLGTRTNFRFNAASAPSSEIQAMLTKFGDMSQLTNINNLFYGAWGAETINLTGAKLNAVTSANSMFQEAKRLRSITWGETDLSGLSSLNSFIRRCGSLESISIPGTAIHITENAGMNYFAQYDYALKTVDLSNVDFTSNVTFTSVFFSCSKLENLTFKANAGIAQNIDVSSCTLLTVASLLSLFGALASGVSGKTCTVGATNLAKLSAAEKAIATDKGWTLA